METAEIFICMTLLILRTDLINADFCSDLAVNATTSLLYKRHCYTWDFTGYIGKAAAAHSCSAKGGHLAVLSGYEELMHIVGQISLIGTPTYYNSYFVGASRKSAASSTDQTNWYFENGQGELFGQWPNKNQGYNKINNGFLNNVGELPDYSILKFIWQYTQYLLTEPPPPAKDPSILYGWNLFHHLGPNNADLCVVVYSDTIAFAPLGYRYITETCDAPHGAICEYEPVSELYSRLAAGEGQIMIPEVTISNQTGISMGHCALLCTKTHVCQGFTYNAANKDCRTHMTDYAHNAPAFAIAQPGYEWFELE